MSDSKETHDAWLLQGRKEAVSTMAPGFANLGRDLLAKNDAITREIMFEAMVRGAVEILLEEEAPKSVATSLCCLAGELVRKK